MKYSNVEKVYKSDEIIGKLLGYFPYIVLALSFLLPFIILGVIIPILIGESEAIGIMSKTAFTWVIVLVGIPLAWGLSPIWSMYHMWKNGGRPITSEEWDQLGGDDLIEMVKDILTEKKLKKLKFYVVDSEEFNAFCMYGGKIAIYRGMFQFDKRTIQAVLLHELGHYYLGHVQILNMIGYSQAGLYPRFAIKRLRKGSNLVRNISPIANTIIFFWPSLLWEVISLFLFGGIFFYGTDILMNKLYRLHEYQSDLFAIRFGYEKEMYEFLKLLQHIEVRQAGSLVDKLYRSHPFTAYRVDKVYRIMKMNQSA